MARYSNAPLPAELNRFILVSLTAPERTVELRYSGPREVGLEKLGRKTNPTLDNLHISREQLTFKLQVDKSGQVMINMTNNGKNSTRLLTHGRRRPARVAHNLTTRVVPEDVVELLYDHQGRYAFKLIECSRSGGPLLPSQRSKLVPSVRAFDPMSIPDTWLGLDIRYIDIAESDDVLAKTIAQYDLFVVPLDRLICGFAKAKASPSFPHFIYRLREALSVRVADAESKKSHMDCLMDLSDPPDQPAYSGFLTPQQQLNVARALVRLELSGGMDCGLLEGLETATAWPVEYSTLPDSKRSSARFPTAGGALTGGGVSAGASLMSEGGEAGAHGGRMEAGSYSNNLQDVGMEGEPSMHSSGVPTFARSLTRAGMGGTVAVGGGPGAGVAGGDHSLTVDSPPLHTASAAPHIPRVQHAGGYAQEAVEEFDEQDEEEDEEALAALEAEGEWEGEGGEGSLDMQEEDGRGEKGGGRRGMQTRKSLSSPATQRSRSGGPVRRKSVVGAGAGAGAASKVVAPGASVVGTTGQAPGTGPSSGAAGGAGVSPGGGSLPVGSIPSYTSSSCDRPPSPFDCKSLANLPLPMVLDIFSYLTLPEVLLCTAVCKEWKEELARPGALPRLYMGQIFPGPLPPDPERLHSLCGRVKGRSLDLSNCAWLTTGCLLAMIGVPLGIQQVARMRSWEMLGLTGKMGEGQRKESAATLAKMIGHEVQGKREAALYGQPLSPSVKVEEMEGAAEGKHYRRYGEPKVLLAGVAAESSLAPGPPWAAHARHSYARHFVGEWSEVQYKEQQGEAAAAAAPALAGSVVASGESTCLLSSTSGSVEPSPTPGGTPPAAPGPSTPVPWWGTLGSGVSLAQSDARQYPAASPAEPWLSPVDMCLGIVGGGVLRDRLLIQACEQWKTTHPYQSYDPPQHLHSVPVRQATTFSSWPGPTLTISEVSSQAYAEMSVALAALKYRYSSRIRPVLEAVQEKEGLELVKKGKGDSTRVGMDDSSSSSDEEEERGGTARAGRVTGGQPGRGITRVGTQPSAARTRDHSTESSSDDAEATSKGRTAAAWGSKRGAVDPSAPVPPLLLSAAHLLDSPCFLASLSTFAPIADIRKKVQAEYEIKHRYVQSKLAAKGGSGVGSRFAMGGGGKGSSAYTPSPPWSLTMQCKEKSLIDSVTAECVLLPVAHVHALAVAYTVAASDLFDWSLYLADAQARRAVLQEQGDTEEAQQQAAVQSHVYDRMLLDEAEGHGSPSHPSSAVPWSRIPSRKLKGQLLSLDIPTPHPPASLTSCSGGARGAPLQGSDGLILTKEENVLGVDVPMTCSTPVQGLNLTCCTRLSASNLALLLSYTPHLTSLTLMGCHQIGNHALVTALQHVPKLRELDLEYCKDVGDPVLSVLGRYCPHLTSLELGGCLNITNEGLGKAGGLLGGVPAGMHHLTPGQGCSKLTNLSLRGCQKVTDEGLQLIADGLPRLRQLCVSGLPELTPKGITYALVTLTKLCRLRVELWFESTDGMDVEGAEKADAGPDAAGRKKHYRVCGSTKGAARYLRKILDANEPLLHALNAAYPEHATVRGRTLEGTGGGGAWPGGTTMQGAAGSHGMHQGERRGEDSWADVSLDEDVLSGKVSARRQQGGSRAEDEVLGDEEGEGEDEGMESGGGEGEPRETYVQHPQAVPMPPALTRPDQTQFALLPVDMAPAQAQAQPAPWQAPGWQPNAEGDRVWQWQR